MLLFVLSNASYCGVITQLVWRLLYMNECYRAKMNVNNNNNNGNFIELFSFWDTNNCKSRLVR